MSTKKGKTVGCDHCTGTCADVCFCKRKMRTTIPLHPEAPVFLTPATKEIPSVGLGRTCVGKILPDPNCPLRCGDLLK